MSDDKTGDQSFIRRLLWVVGSLVVVGGLAVVVWKAADILFLLFTGLLFGVFLLRASKWVADKLPISRTWALAGIVLLFVTAFAGANAIFGVQLKGQVVEASKHLDDAAIKLDKELQKWPNIRSTLIATPLIGDALKSLREATKQSGSDSNSANQSEGEAVAGESPPSPDLSNESSSSNASNDDNGSSSGMPAGVGFALNGILKTFTTTFGLVLNSLIVFVIAIYFGLSPNVYRDGLLRLFPPKKRDRMREVFGKIETAMFRWLIGRFASMAITGVSTGVVLLLLGVPMPFTVGVITALLTFIPNIGGIIALSIAVLLALPSGLGTAGAVILLYSAMQLVESNVITPLIQKRQISMPPALLIGFQAIVGVLFGFIGLMVASPILAAGMVAINELYIKDTLKDDDAPDLVES